MQKNTGRFDVLDGLRGIAAISVCIYHLTQHSPHPVLQSSNFAVDLFFCLSGFVVAHAYTEKLSGNLSFGRFAAKRLVRLYPMYIVGIAIGAVALYLKIAQNETSLTNVSATLAIFLNSIYIPYLGDSWVKIGSDRVTSAIFPVNDPGWSLFFELIVNIIFAAVAVNAKNRRAVFVGIVILSALGLIVWCASEAYPAPGWGVANIAGGFPRSIYGFFVGVVLNQAKINLNIKIHPALLVGILMICFLTVSKHWGLWLVATLIISPLLVLLGSMSEVRAGVQGEIFKWLGNISYPLYCIHFPIYSVTCVLSGASFINSIYSIFLSIFFAHFLHKYIEPRASRQLWGIVDPSSRSAA